MNILAVIMADLDSDFFAAPSTLSQNIDSENVLYRTAKKTLLLDNIDNVVLACPTGQAHRCRELLGNIVMDIVEYDSVGNRRYLIRSARTFGRYGWRGGMADTTVFDELLDPMALNAACSKFPSAAVLLVPAGAMLMDIKWTNSVIERFLEDPGTYEYTFNQAPVGLSAGLITLPFIKQVFEANTHFGRMLGYDPNAPRHDLVFSPACVKLDDAIVNTPRRFLADSPRGFWLCSKIAEIVGPDASGEEICRAAREIGPEPWPRELTVELTCRRPLEDKLRPSADRTDMELAELVKILAGLDEPRDVNIMFDGLGDTLLHPHWEEAVEIAAGCGAVGISTYLHELDDTTLDKLISGNIDVIQINIDAHDAELYNKYKTGGDFERVWENIRRISSVAAERGQRAPFLVPYMTKTPDMLDIQEEFYDHCATTTGWSVIAEPSNCCGSLPDMGVFDMSPPVRTACLRLNNRLTVLSDGTVTACDEDMVSVALALKGNNVLEIWRSRQLAALRQLHADGCFEKLDQCVKCREFHRP